jgi:HAD superfamily hydrolase (TIGR01484 family)
MAYTHIFFDLDKTLTEARSERDERMAELLRALAERKAVGIISGAQRARMDFQLPELRGGGMYTLSQNGGTAFDTDGTLLWQKELSQADEKAIYEHIARLRELHEESDIDTDDLIEHRGSQICFSFIGHNADKERKKRWDPKGEKRSALLGQCPFTSERVEVRIGGTTTLDYIARGYDKGGTLLKLLQQKDVSEQECLYVGDALFAGGNDEAAFGVMDVCHTCGPEETKEIIQRLLHDDRRKCSIA